MAKDGDDKKCKSGSSSDEQKVGVPKSVRWSAEFQGEATTDTTTSSSGSNPGSNNASGVARMPGRHTDDLVHQAQETRQVVQAQAHSAKVMLHDDWELTWPIWHMLPWQDRKEIAQRHGYQTIGAFEEYMSLQKALDDDGIVPGTSSTGSVGNGFTTRVASQPGLDGDLKLKSHGLSNLGEDEEEEEDSDTEEDQQVGVGSSGSSSESEDENGNVATSSKQMEEESDSPLLTFPDDILHKIFSFLPVTLFGTKLACVSAHPHWKRLTRSEHAMKQLCERVYLQQSKKKQLRVAKFHHSYRYMLYQRPRVQAGGGIYVLRFAKVKPIQRDMWTEVPVGAILETVYYRYLYFEEGGQCLYALSPFPPQDMFKRFHRVLLQSSHDHDAVSFGSSSAESTGVGGKRASTKKAPRKLTRDEKERRAAELDTRVVWGTYAIQKDRLTVTAKQSWQTVQFILRIVAHNNRPYQEHTYLHHHHQHQQQQQHNDGNPVVDSKPRPIDITKKPNMANLKAVDENGDRHEYVDASTPITISPHGRFGVLRLEQHRSSVSGIFDEHDTYIDTVTADGHHHAEVFHRSDVVNFPIELDQTFRFIPDARF